MDSASLHRWFKKALKRAGLSESIKIHELRHSAADNLYRETGNIVLSQQLPRHESVATTQDYLHPAREDLAEALASLHKGRGACNEVVRLPFPQSARVLGTFPRTHDNQRYVKLTDENLVLLTPAPTR